MQKTIEVKNKAGQWVRKTIEVLGTTSQKKESRPTVAKNKTEKSTKKSKVTLKIMPALKAGVRIAVPVGAGALASVVGGGLARALSEGIADFSDTPTKSAAVDAGAGVILSGAGLMVYAKMSTPKKAMEAAPLVLAGAVGIPVFRALAPTVVDYLEQGIAMLMGDAVPALPAGAYADIGGGLQGRLPAGVRVPAGAYADIGGGLQGRLPAGGATNNWGEGTDTYYGPQNTTGNRLPAGGAGPTRI